MVAERERHTHNHLMLNLKQFDHKRFDHSDSTVSKSIVSDSAIGDLIATVRDSGWV